MCCGGPGLFNRRTGMLASLRSPANFVLAPSKRGPFGRQRMTNAVGAWQTRVEMGTVPPDQVGKPVTRESPKPVTPRAVPCRDPAAEARIAGVNRVRARRQLANPMSWQCFVQPKAGFLQNGRGNGARGTMSVSNSIRGMRCFMLVDWKVSLATI